MKSKVAIAIMLASAAGGCITSQAMPLSPNQVRIGTRAGGLLFVNQTVPTTMREAATQTLRAGYTHFKLSQAGVGRWRNRLDVVFLGTIRGRVRRRVPSDLGRLRHRDHVQGERPAGEGRVRRRT